MCILYIYIYICTVYMYVYIYINTHMYIYPVFASSTCFRTYPVVFGAYPQVAAVWNWGNPKAIPQGVTPQKAKHWTTKHHQLCGPIATPCVVKKEHRTRSYEPWKLLLSHPVTYLLANRCSYSRVSSQSRTKWDWAHYFLAHQASFISNSVSTAHMFHGPETMKMPLNSLCCFKSQFKKKTPILRPSARPAAGVRARPVRPHSSQPARPGKSANSLQPSLSIHPSIHPSTYLPTYLSIYLSIYIYIYMCVCVSIASIYPFYLFLRCGSMAAWKLNKYHMSQDPWAPPNENLAKNCLCIKVRYLGFPQLVTTHMLATPNGCDWPSIKSESYSS